MTLVRSVFQLFHFYFLFHSYNNCGSYQITIKAYNKVSSGNRTTNLQVACPFSGFELDGRPKSGPEYSPQVAERQKASLHVIIVEGSFAVFTIDWGDGSPETVDDRNLKAVVSL